MRKCKYCDSPAKVNYHGIKRRHKGYYRTCGNEKCLSRRYEDKVVNQKKAYINKNEKVKCAHCKKEFIKETSTHKWCKECVPNKDARAIMQRYGLSRKQHLELINQTSGICPICRKNKASVVDHDHKTGKVRGILCNHCNMTIALVENTEALKRALIYLKI